MSAGSKNIGELKNWAVNMTFWRGRKRNYLPILPLEVRGNFELFITSIN
ncbi:MAG: hypothetical protein SCK70_17265 [bacterium]|nr:hypothetical protein [bacterium]